MLERWSVAPPARPARFACLVLLATLTAYAPAALARPGCAAGAKRTMRRAYAKGKRAFGAGEFDKAATLFGEAHATCPDPALLFNGAKAHEQAGDPIAALTHYERFLAAAPKARNRKAVQRSIDSLRAKLATTHTELTVRSTPPGAAIHLGAAAEPVGTTPWTSWHKHGTLHLRLVLAKHLPASRELELGPKGPSEVTVKLVSEHAPGTVTLLDASEGATLTVDGEAAGTTPLPKPLQLSPGSHELRLERDGQLPFVATVQVKPAEPSELKVTWTPVPVPPPPPEPRPLAPWPAWALGGTAAAALTGGVVFALLSNASAEQARDLSSTIGADVDRWEESRDEGERRALLSKVSYGLGAVALVGAAAFVALHYMPAEGEEAAEPGDAPAAGEGDDSGPAGSPPESKATPPSALLLPTPGGLSAAVLVRF